VATDKAYARKLEAKLSASKSISDLHARCSQYKLKLRELAQELEEAESRTASVQEIADVRADEVYISNASLAHKLHKSHVIHQEVICQSTVPHKALIEPLQKHISELPGLAQLSHVVGPVKLLLAVACLTCCLMFDYSNMCLHKPESSLPDALCLTLCIQGVALACIMHHAQSGVSPDLRTLRLVAQSITSTGPMLLNACLSCCLRACMLRNDFLF